MPHLKFDAPAQGAAQKSDEVSESKKRKHVETSYSEKAAEAETTSKKVEKQKAAKEVVQDSSKKEKQHGKGQDKGQDKEKEKEKKKDKNKEKKHKKQKVESSSESESEPEESASSPEKPKKQEKSSEKKQEKPKEKKDKKDDEKEVPVKTTTFAKPVAEWMQSNNISVTGEDVPEPFQTFESAAFPDYITAAISNTKFKNPTPIQAQGWPVAVAGRDMIGLAETGSGKTLAFMIPAVMHVRNKNKSARKKGPSVLVLAPTRELAQQIDEVAQSVCATSSITSVCIYGGVSKGPQVSAIRAGAEIIVATPGRLIDLMQENVVKLHNVSFLVLDEADRMLDMGFGVQIKEIMTQVPDERQTAMYSATWPDDVQRLAHNYFKNPVRITIGSENLSGAATVTQTVIVCAEHEKFKQLKALLTKIYKPEKDKECRILVFMLYKKSCERMNNDLLREGWPCDSINGDKSQNARDAALANFKSGKAPILVATDVAARGLDIKNVSYVINVEFPLKCEDYVHRIGRTGRAGATGTAYTLFTADDKVHARELVQIMEESNQIIPPELQAIADKAPGIKAKKTAMMQMYGDFAKVDPKLAAMKPTRTVF